MALVATGPIEAFKVFNNFEFIGIIERILFISYNGGIVQEVKGPAYRFVSINGKPQYTRNTYITVTTRE